MMTLAPRARLADALDLAVRGTLDDSIRRQVWSLLAELYPHQRLPERRTMQRFAFPQLIYLTPTRRDGRTPSDRTAVVVGKTLSEGGLGFFHQKPLVERRVIVSLPGQNLKLTGFLLDINWCRFTTQCWYESGGRFLEVVESPVKLVG